MNKVRDIVRWALLVTCIVFGLLYLNGAFGSWWASWGPPTEYPEAWEQQAVKRLCIAVALLFTGPMVFVTLKNGYKFKKSIYIYVWFVVVILSLSYPSVREFVLIDKCLDSGGAWSEEHFECNH